VGGTGVRVLSLEGDSMSSRDQAIDPMRVWALQLLDDPEFVEKLRARLAPPAKAGAPRANDYETIEQTARRYLVSAKTVQRWLAHGLPCDRPTARIVRIQVEEARAFIESGALRVTRTRPPKRKPEAA
jgi:hypothetical protein